MRCRHGDSQGRCRRSQPVRVAASAICKLLIILAPQSVSAAARLEDHTASWEAAGLGDVIATGHNNALPLQLLAAVTEAAAALVHETDESHKMYKFNKRNTWFLMLNDGARRRSPRSAVEAAIHELYDLVFGDADTPIIGAEWWIQEQPMTAGIGFHYDKDEAFASEHMTMRFPEVSTVTYLGDAGAPTLILNQTTPDGSREIPPLPREGMLSYPRSNRHLVFRGNLQHGVVGELSLSAPDPSRRRRTLLVNWWREAPMPPNCVEFSDKRWRRNNQLLDANEIQRLLRMEDGGHSVHSVHSGHSGHSGKASKQSRLEWTEMVLEKGATQRVQVDVPPTDMLFFDFPKAPVLKPDTWAVRWDESNSMGPITRLDLMHQSSTTAIFHDQRPKLIFVLTAPGGGTDWSATLPRWLQALHREYASRLKFVIADAASSDDFMRSFSLTANDAPTAIIHDNHHNDAKYIIKERPMRAAAVRRFIQGFLFGKLDRDEL